MNRLEHRSNHDLHSRYLELTEQVAKAVERGEFKEAEKLQEDAKQLLKQLNSGSKAA